MKHQRSLQVIKHKEASKKNPSSQCILKLVLKEEFKSWKQKNLVESNKHFRVSTVSVEVGKLEKNKNIRLSTLRLKLTPKGSRIFSQPNI